MADEAQRFTARTGSLQSRIANSKNAKQQQAASSSAAAKSGSTTTPTITSTPKVTNTAKAIPSVTRVDISKLAVPTVTPTVTTPREQAMNLLGSKTRVEPLKKAEVPDMLNGHAQPTGIAGTINKWLYEIPQKITQEFGETVKESNLFEKGKNLVIDTARFGISTAQGLLERYGTTDLPVGGQTLNNSEMGTRIKEQRNNTLKTIFDELESRDQRLSKDKGYQESKKEAEKWAESGKGIRQALQESNWDVVITRAGEIVAQMIPAFATAVITKNPKIAAGTVFTTVYGDAYKRNLTDVVKDPDFRDLTGQQKTDLASLLATTEATIEALGDMLELAPFMKGKTSISKMLGIKNALASFVANWQGSAITEGLEEVSTEALQTWLKQAYGSLDEISLKELGQIFSDTYLLMQIAGLGGGAGGVVETRNRNEAEKILEQEAKKFNNFNDFEAAAQRGGVEDNSIIQDAWAKAKGLTKEQSQTIKYDVKYVEKQEEETTKLYEEKESVENKLESLRESGEEKNKTQISKLETRLQEIDNQINEIDKSIQEYMEVYGEELPATQAINTEGGEVMMSDDSVINSKPIDDMSDDEILSARAYWLKNKPTTPQERRREKDIQNEIKARENNVVLSDEIKQALADLSFDVEGLSEIEARAIIDELSRLMSESDNFDMRNKYYALMIKVRSKAKELSEKESGDTDTEERDNPSILPETEIDDTLFYNKAGRGLGLDQYAFRIYYQDRKHIPGLKGIKVAGLENLSDAEIMEIARSAAIVAGTLGIDFNKILENAHFSVLSLKGEEVKGTEGISGRLNTQMNRMMPEILQLAIILKDTGPSVFGHELMHLLDKEYLFRNNKLWTRGGNLSRSSLLKDPKFKTYNKPYESYKYDDTNYWDTSREILARFAEQYVAFKNDKREYDAYTGKNFYWSDAEFKKLIGRFESLLSNFSDFALETSDREVYPEIVKKMAELQYSQTQFGLGTETEIVYKLADMKEQYDEIVAEIEKVKNETLRIELETEASNLYSNFEMLNKMGENYTQIQKTTNELQNLMDSITTEVIPTPPQDPDTIENGLPQLGGSNIEKGIDEISKGESPDESFMKSYMTETQKIKINNRKNKIKTFRKELGQTMKDIFTPTLSRIYNISPRVAGRLVTMETQTEINIHKYRQRAKGFVETLGKLKGKNALEVKMALLDYGALASEQGENIEEYKKEEVAKLKEVLRRNGFKEEDINDMFYVLNDIGQQYKDAGLSINLSDMYFPRVVKDYEGLIDYMNRESGGGIKVNKTSLLIKIRQIQEDPDMTDEEKERKIRSAISIEFKQPGTTSKHGKERKLGLLSERGPGIYAYYENPIQSIDHYIVTMTNAIQRQLFLGGMVEDANITESEILNRNTSESVSTIIGRLVELGMVDEEDVDELQKSILAVLNKKPSPKSVTAIKDITYISTITNFLSAINQLDDLGMVILKDRSGLKHIVKTIFGRAGIKYDDLGLEDSYEMFKEEGSITNWLFKKSFFNTFDRLGKTSFVNTAWESMVRQSKNEKTRKYLYSRLVAMYGRESADRMMDKIDRNDYRGEDGQVDIEILRDLLYQLGSTQPIYTSAMSTTYLNNPRARLCYALSSFTLKRIDWLIQGTKEVNAKHGPVAAGAWVMGVSSFLAMFGAVIGDLGDLLKGDKEETFLWKFINEGIDEALKSGGSDALDSWLKIWDLSEYDIKTYKQQGLWGVFSAKIKPFIFDLGKDITQAITEGDADEITDLAKYVPIFGKLVYYWLWDDLESSTDELLDLGEDLDLDLGEDLDLDLDGELLDL